jgi:hypothetical protein
MRDTEWFPILDEASEPMPLTVEAIGKCASADELRTCYLRITEAPLSDVERSALMAALQTRAGHLNISTYDFMPYDNGMMSQTAGMMAEGMSDSVVRGSTAVVALLDAAPGKPLRFRFKGTEAGVISLNERVFLPEILTDAVNRLATLLRSGHRVSGEELHPPMDQTDPANPRRKRFRQTPARAILEPERAFMAGGDVLVDARVIENTEPGRRLADDLRAGRPVFFSTRAYGGDIRLVPLTDGRQVKVPLLMDLETWDRVPNPAIPDAVPVAVLDSVQMQAITDSVHGKAPAPAAIQNPQKEGSTVKWTLGMVKAMAATSDGRRELAVALTDSTLDAEIRTAMTDALAMPLQASAPAAATIPADVVNQAVTDALNRQAESARQAEEARTRARSEAATFVKEQIAALRTAGRYPSALLDNVATALTDCADKATAEAQLRDRLAIADSFLTGGILTSLGYRGGANGATLHTVDVTGQARPWQPIVDNLRAAFDDHQLTMFGTRPDAELRKTNKPFVDKLLRKFDIANAKALLDAANAWESIQDSITTADLWNQIIVQRALLEQAFGDADMLQFVGTDVFEGDTYTVPVEYYESSGSVTHRTGEMQPMASGKVKTVWIPFTASPRRIMTEISNDTQRGMSSGPLKYNASARALYHIMAEVRRVINRDAGNEMLRASDAYGAVAVADETVAAGELATVTDATNVKYKVTLRRGGATGALTATNTDRPAVRPRTYTSYAGNGQATTVAENPFTVTINGAAVAHCDLRKNDDGTVSIVDAAGANATGFAVDYENGYLHVSDGFTITPGTADCVIDYSYATNFTTWTLTPTTTGEEAKHYSSLLRLIGMQAALMAKHPRYREPNIALGSLTAMEYAIQADVFYQLNSPKGVVLNPNTGNFVASRNGVDYAKHNTQWDAGDGRILLGRVNATKFAVRDPLAPQGPFPSYDAAGKILPGQQWYVEGWDAMVTPEVRNQAGTTLNPYYRTIKLKA